MPQPSTFSIVAADLEEPAWGVAVASRFLAVGAVVPYAQAGAGAIATQSYANPSYGPNGLALLGQGLSAQEALDRLVAEDEGRALRQAGIVVTAQASTLAAPSPARGMSRRGRRPEQSRRKVDGRARGRGAGRRRQPGQTVGGAGRRQTPGRLRRFQLSTRG